LLQGRKEVRTLWKIKETFADLEWLKDNMHVLEVVID